MTCTRCGAPLSPDSTQCKYCGGHHSDAFEKQREPVVQHVYNILHAAPAKDAELSPKKRWKAILWCLTFGFLGAHKFYVGKMGAGIFYLFTLGGFGLFLLFDIIGLVFGDPTDGWGRKLS